MFYALSWLLVFTLLALWSFTAWALHAVAVWTVSQAGALSGTAAVGATLSVPDWLAPWVPPELAQAMGTWVAGFAPLVDGLLQAAPALSGGLTVLAWAAWGLGVAALLLLGAGLHLLIALWRRRGGGPGAQPGRPLVAG